MDLKKAPKAHFRHSGLDPESSLQLAGWTPAGVYPAAGGAGGTVFLTFYRTTIIKIIYGVIK
jgi:hypothetical protein